MATTQEIIKEVMEGKGAAIPENRKKAYEELMENIFENGMSPREAMGIGEGFVESAYLCGHTLFQSGKYNDAICVFKWLRMVEPFVYRYPFGIAACYHNLKDYQKAIGYYTMAASLDGENPEPYFYMADCFIMLNLNDGAVILLEKAIPIAKDKPKFASIYERSQMILKGLLAEKTVESQGEKK